MSELQEVRRVYARLGFRPDEKQFAIRNKQAASSNLQKTAHSTFVTPANGGFLEGEHESPIESEDRRFVQYLQLPRASLDNVWNRKYLQKAKRWIPLLRHLPGVRAAFLCNSVALGTATQHSDIDLFIVTDASRLWVARCFVTCILHILRLRRHGNNIAGRFCLSFFATENALNMEKIALQPHDPYLALWTATLIPVFGSSVANTVIAQNQEFVSRSLGAAVRFSADLAEISKGDSRIRTSLEIAFGRRWNQLLKTLFLPRAEHKKARLVDASGTIISDEMLKFHNTDRRGSFLLER